MAQLIFAVNSADRLSDHAENGDILITSFRAEKRA